MVKEFTGKHMAFVVAGFFGTIITVNLVLAYFAVGTWTGLVVKNSYVASQHFNEQLADGRRMKALGWSGNVSYDTDGVVFRLTDKNGDALAGVSVNGVLKRPAHENDDHEIIFAEKLPGLYMSKSAIATGTWDLDVTAVDQQGRRFRNVYRMTVSAGS